MEIVPIHDFETATPLAEAWDRLAGEIPFRGWTWNATWWRHYAQDRGDRWRPLVAVVLDSAGRVIGVAPWYLDERPTAGRVIRLLGAGELHPDYLGFLCRPGREDDVAAALARWLSQARDDPPGDGSARWDQIELTCLDAADPVAARLAARLEAAGNTVHCRRGDTCWRITLPRSVEEYVAGLSKNSRKKFRRIQRRMFDSGRARLRMVTNARELAVAMGTLVELHQRRRRALGQPGCFASTRFRAFHEDVARRMLLAGQMLLHVLSIDGRPAAAEYAFAGGGIIYAYQGGIDPERLELEPGRVATTAVLRWAIENGYQAYDLMRGDEPYKSHWRPEPRESLEIRVVAPHAAAQLRHAAWLAATGARAWIKRGLEPFCHRE